MTTIWWLRRDLRLDDNPTLQAAINSAGEIVPIFILDPELWDSQYAGKKRKDIQRACVRRMGIYANLAVV